MTTSLAYALGNGGYQFADQAQKDQLVSLVDIATKSDTSRTGVGAVIYNYLLSQIRTAIIDPLDESVSYCPAAGVDVSVYDWIAAAAGINGGL
jgi:hypothetical protein